MRALVLSGGGSKGQYSVGAIQHLMGVKGIQYDIICGVSVGALIAAYLCQFPKGEEAEAAEGLLALFSNVRNQDVWKHWKPFRYLHGLWKGGLTDSSPLRQTIKDKLDVERVRTAGRELRIGVTSLTSGLHHTFTQDAYNLAELVYASAAFPVAFEPSYFDKQWWSDGGIHTVTPVKAAIDAGATHVDVVLVAPCHAIPRVIPHPTTIQVAVRTIELMTDKMFDADIKLTILHNALVKALQEPDTTKRYVHINVIRPQQFMTENSLDFNQLEAAIMRARGFRDASIVCPVVEE